MLSKINWNPFKALANWREHAASFAQAATVLSDEHALTREVNDAVGEQRFVTM